MHALTPRSSEQQQAHSCSHPLTLLSPPQGMRASMSSVHAMRIMETVEELNKLLDVEKPWTWIVHDPSGMSEFKPDDGVTVETGVTREQGDEQQQGQQPAAAGDTTAAVPTAADASAAQQQLESLD
jgi:hypothetical protein